MFKEVNPNPLKGMLAIKLALLSLFLLLAGCGGGGGGGGGTIPVTLDSIEISAITNTLITGTSLNLTVTGTYSDSSTADLTSNAQLAWTSSNPSFATVSATGVGKVTAVAAGNVTITGTLLGVLVDTISISVTAPPASGLATIEINPPTASVAIGLRTQFTATGYYTDGTQADITNTAAWSSTGNATVIANGLIAGASAGDATITATFGGKQGTATLTVDNVMLTSIEITPAPLSIAKGTKYQLKATGLYDNFTKADITELVTWTDSGSATVNDASGSKGLITADTTAGGATITATLGAKNKVLSVTVTDAALGSLEIQPVNPFISNGTKLAFTAIGHFDDAGVKTVQDLTGQVTWNSVDGTGQAPITSAGLASATSVGTATISANVDIASSGNKNDSTTLTVTSSTLKAINISPEEATLAVGSQTKLTATGNFSDGDTQDFSSQVTWASTDSSIVRVDSAGRITAVAPGTIRISARFGTGADAVIGSVQIVVSAASVTLSSLAITSDYASMAPGTKQSLTATATYSDFSTQIVTDQVVWSSDDEALALVSNDFSTSGNLWAVSAGTANITAKLLGVTSPAVPITIHSDAMDDLTVSASSAIVNVGDIIQLTATASFGASPDQDVTDQVVWSWATTGGEVSVSNAASSRGQVFGITDGTVTVTATFGGFSDDYSVTVNSIPASPVSLTIIAEPNVIYANGADSTTLTISVLAADNVGPVVDTTQINLSISGSGTIPATVNISGGGGQATATLTSGTPGLNVITATVDGTTVSNTVPVVATTNFTNMLGLAATFAGNETSGNLDAGAFFGLFVTNLSNREFSVDLFGFGGLGSTPYLDSVASRLSDGNLIEGEQMGYIVQTAGDPIPMSDFASVYTLSTNIPTAESFSAGAVFDLCSTSPSC